MILEQLLSKEEGAVESTPGNEGRIAPALTNVRGWIAGFRRVSFLRSDRWTMRIDAPMEPLVKQAGTASHRCLVMRDAAMDPREFRQGLWFKESVC